MRTTNQKRTQATELEREETEGENFFLLSLAFSLLFSCVCSVWLLLSWVAKRFALDDEKLVLSKLLVKISFIYGVSREFLYIC